MGEAIASLVADLASRHEIETVGVGAAGYVDKSRSMVLFAPEPRLAQLRPQGRARGPSSSSPS